MTSHLEGRVRQAPTPIEVSRLADALKVAREVMVEATKWSSINSSVGGALGVAIDEANAALASMASTPVGEVSAGWREHVEQRMRAWRQRFVNKSGDQLALDDFMDSESLDDLLDYVLDEWASPAPAASKGLSLSDAVFGSDALRAKALAATPSQPEAQKAVAPSPDYSEMSREQLERHATRMAQMLNDSRAIKFHERHAFGPMMAPSCLCCGKLPDKVAIKHLELPGIVICESCRDKALASPSPAASMEVQGLTEAEIDCEWFTSDLQPQLYREAPADLFAAGARWGARALAAKNGWRLGDQA